MVSMDATLTLPDDSSSLKNIILELVATLKGKDRQIDQLEHRLDLLLRSRCGRSSEKINPAELLPALRALFEQKEEAAPAKQEEPAETETIVYERKKPGHGRKKSRRICRVSKRSMICPRPRSNAGAADTIWSVSAKRRPNNPQEN